MDAELMLVNGQIYTFDPQQPRARALAFAQGRALLAGEQAQVLERRGPRTDVIDLQGRTVLPGLVDAHIHFTSFAMGLEQVNLEGTRSAEEAAARVAVRVTQAAAGEWIRGHSWNHHAWAVPRFPTKAVLDAVVPHHPVVLTRKDAHSLWVNSAALVARGITRETPNPEGGVIERDEAGEPTGILRENAMRLMGVGFAVGEEEVPLPTLRRAIAEAHRHGLTGIHNIEGGPALRAFQELRRRDELTLRVAHFFPSQQLEQAIAIGLQQGLGDEWIQIAGVKLFADGSLGSRTAAMLQPYEGSSESGMMLSPPEELARLARLAARNRLMVAVHAIGDRANRAVLDVYEKLRCEGSAEAALRLEHAQHLTREDISRLKQLDVTASMQPIQQPSDMALAERLLGQRCRYTYAFKSLQRAGARLAFGSDCPIETLDPLRGIHAAVTRQDEQGEPPAGWYPEERLSVSEAVQAYLTPMPDRWRAGGKSSTTQGLRPDWIVLSQNIFEIPPAEIVSTRVECTLVGGKVVYGR